MRKFWNAIVLLAAGMAHAEAADMTAPTYKAPVAAPFSWTGFYLGVHGGGGWGNSDWQINSFTIGQNPTVIVPINSNPSNLNGFLGGAQAGFNLQYGPLVGGVEADWSATNLKGKGSCSVILPPAWATLCSTDADWFATVAGRLGMSFDRTLLYVKGGAAWVQESFAINMQRNANPPTQGAAQSISSTRTGWLLGAGVEHAFWDNWSAKVEYNYMDFGSKNATIIDPNGGAFAAPVQVTANIDQHIHVVKFGVNYRFAWR